MLGIACAPLVSRDFSLRHRAAFCSVLPLKLFQKRRCPYARARIQQRPGLQSRELLSEHAAETRDLEVTAIVEPAPRSGPAKGRRDLPSRTRACSPCTPKGLKGSEAG